MWPRTPSKDDLDAEIRGHLALSIKERIERGEDPTSARLAALKEFGNVTLTRESMRGVWRYRWLDGAEALGRDMRFALRSLLRARGLAATVVVTLALGIGANAAIFSVVRGVLLRPLVNRDEDHLIYIGQRAPGLGAENITFSIAELNDFKARITTITAFGDFSTVDFALSGLGGEPRMVKAGVVGGSFFDVMGLRPVLGRLLNPNDDGPNAAGAAVLTYRFWTTSLNSDPNVVGTTIRLGPRTATVVGVLEPSVPYPADTEIIANVVTSPHHLGATMVTDRTHRMTELFGRLAPGVSLEAARAELTAVHTAMVREHPEAYSKRANVELRVTTLRDQIASPARTILLVLLAAAAVVFVIACSNIANLILARSVRREGELAVRAALGAGRGALRRTLLAESLVLCGAGAVLGVMLAQPFVAIVARYAARFSVRALEVTVDTSVLWVGAGLAMGAAVLLAYVPRLPSPHAPTGLGLVSGSVRITPGTNRRLRVFATTQIACSFVLLAGAGTLLTTLIPCKRPSPATTCGRCWPSTFRSRRRAPTSGAQSSSTSIKKRRDASENWQASKASPLECSCRGGMPGASVLESSSPSRATRRQMAKRIRTRGFAWSRLASSPSSASRCSRAATSRTMTAGRVSLSSSSARASRSGCSRTATR